MQALGAVPASGQRPNPLALLRARKAAHPRIQTAREIAYAVVDHMRADPLDHYYTHAEVDAWIDEWSAHSGIALERTHREIRAAIKEVPGVRYRQRNVRQYEEFADLRFRLDRALGHVPQKVWLFRVTPGEAEQGDWPLRHSAPEHVTAGVLEKHLAVAARDSPAGSRPRAAERGGRDSEGIPKPGPDPVPPPRHPSTTAEPSRNRIREDQGRPKGRSRAGFGAGPGVEPTMKLKPTAKPAAPADGTTTERTAGPSVPARRAA